MEESLNDWEDKRVHSEIKVALSIHNFRFESSEIFLIRVTWPFTIIGGIVVDMHIMLTYYPYIYSI